MASGIWKSTALIGSHFVITTSNTGDIAQVYTQITEKIHEAFSGPSRSGCRASWGTRDRPTSNKLKMHARQAFQPVIQLGKRRDNFLAVDGDALTQAQMISTITAGSPSAAAAGRS